VTLAISATNTAGPLLGAALMRRTSAPDEAFTSLRGLGGFLFGGLALHAAVTASGGTLALMLGENLPVAKAAGTWASWWLSDAGGVLYLGPTLLLWLANGAAPAEVRRAEEIAVWAGTAIAAALLFGSGAAVDPKLAALPYLLALPLAWVTLRWSLRSASTLFTLVSVIATAGTVAGIGPFNRLGLDNPLVALGGLVVLCGVNVLLVGTMAGERRAAALRLADANRALEDRVRERTRELEAARAAAEAAARAKSRFLATMSHELRTPLTGVLGAADLLLAGVITAEQEALVRAQVESGESLLRTIEAMLALSQGEAGEDRAATAFAPRTLLPECLATVRMVADSRGLILAWNVDPAVPPGLSGHPGRIREVLRELLGNAVRFTPAGEVRLTLVSLGVAAGRHRVRFAVEDTGPGIAADDQARLFLPFDQLDDSSTRRHGGAGLGLARCRQQVEAMGGRIGVDSKPGAGSRFWFELALPLG
jgi:signal transduction histidine kinase